MAKENVGANAARIELAKQKELLGFTRRAGRNTVPRLRSALSNAGIRRQTAQTRERGQTRSLFQLLGYSVKQKFGDVEGVGFKATRYGFILAQGFRHNRSGKVIPPKDWLSSPLSQTQNELADFTAKLDADAVVKLIQFKQDTNRIRL